MTSPSHHALWNPAYEERGSRLNKVLIITLDTGPGYQYNSGGSEIVNITAQETADGYTVTTITDYAAFLNEDLTKYAHIWDLGFNTLIPAEAKTKYIAYLQNGGAAFMLGENAGFVARNTDICNLVGQAGGGSVTTGGSYGVITVSIVPEFRLANTASTVTFTAPGSFVNIGSGTAITTGATCAVMWKTGSLSNCVRGALVSILDVNFLQNQYLQSDFIDNLAVMLNRK